MKLPQNMQGWQLKEIDWRTTVSLINGCLAMLFLLLTGKVCWSVVETITNWIR